MIIVDKAKRSYFRLTVILAIWIAVNSVFSICAFSQEYFANGTHGRLKSSGYVYRNPRVYNLDYTFELCPNKDSIDSSKDLKLWIPIPREWDSQKAVKIISVEPEPHAEYEDPEHGNRMLFWDFGKEKVRPSYKVKIRCRLISFEINAVVNPGEIGSYDKISEEYMLYTRSTYTISITPEVHELAQIAIGDETNPYLQAKRIQEYVGKKVHYKILDQIRGRGIQCLLNYPEKDERTGEEYYEGPCNQKSALFIAMCRAVGIPARSVQGIMGWKPWSKKNDLKLLYEFETELSPSGLAGAQDYGVLRRHTWAEFYLPDYGWIPADPTWGHFGYLVNWKIILCKGRDILIGPDAPQDESQGYGIQWVELHNGRADSFQRAVWNIAKIQKAKMTTLHYSDPFPADAYAEYSRNLYPESEPEEKLINCKKDFLLTLISHSLKDEDQNQNTNDIVNNNPCLNSNWEAYLLHVLNQITGMDNFREIFKRYLDLQLTTGNSVSTEKFREITESIHGSSLDSFFNKVIYGTPLSELKLDSATDILSELIRMEDSNSAINHYKKLRDKNPDEYGFSKEQLEGLGLDLRETNMFDESITIYKWIIDLYPDWFGGYNGIADVYKLKGDNELAIKYYAKSLELFPDLDYARDVIDELNELTEQDN
jgi:tetratricopeptide (TPR) repeat protein